MKTRIAAVALAAAALCAGSTLAQTRPQTTAPRAAVPAPPPAVGTVPAGQGQGQTRGTVHGGVGTFEGETALVVPTRPQALGPRAGVPVAPPAVGTVPAGQGQAPRIASGDFVNVDSSNRDHLDQDAQMDVSGSGRMTTGQTPTNGVGGTGGGRLAAPGGGDAPVAAEAPVNTSRSNIKKPSLAVAPEAGASPAPVPVPVAPR